MTSMYRSSFQSGAPSSAADTLRSTSPAAYPLEFDEEAHEAYHRSTFLHRHAIKRPHSSSSLHSSANFDNTLPSMHDDHSSVAHPHPPDASNISPNSSQDAMSPQSSSPHSSASSASMHTSMNQSTSSSSITSHIGSTRAALDMGAEGRAPLSPEDFPLVSREPSRGPSKSSLRSVDPTNMHSPPKFYEQQRRQLQEVSPASSMQRPLSRIAAERDDQVQSTQRQHGRNKFDAIRAANGSHAISRSVSGATTTAALSATYSFINDAERRRHEAEEQKRKRINASRKQWEQHIANKREFIRPKVEQQNESAFQHRLFNLKVRELHRQEDMNRTGEISGPKHQRGLSSSQGLHYTEPGADAAAAPRGLSFWDLQTILYHDFIHQIVPQQLNWIGKSGDRDRCAVPPMMATARSQQEPIVLSSRTATSRGGDRTQRTSSATRGESARQSSTTTPLSAGRQGQSHSQAAAYQALQEEKWFVAAQQRFHKIAQHE